jgi:hypothetical protein
MAGPAYYTGEMRIAKNEDWIVPFLYGSGDPTAVPPTFVPIDLTGSTIKLAIRKNEADHEATIWVQSPDDGVTFTDAVNGEFMVKISREKLLRVEPGEYVSDMVRLMPTGDQERLWEGTATVVHGTTP